MASLLFRSSQTEDWPIHGSDSCRFESGNARRFADRRSGWINVVVEPFGESRRSMTPEGDNPGGTYLAGSTSSVIFSATRRSGSLKRCEDVDDDHKTHAQKTQFSSPEDTTRRHAHTMKGTEQFPTEWNSCDGINEALERKNDEFASCVEDDPEEVYVEDDPEEVYLILEAKEKQDDSDVKADVTVGESEGEESSDGNNDGDRENCNDDAECDSAQEIPGNEVAEPNHLAVDEDNLRPSKEDDIWSDEELISSEAKGFPPPISILANESHPGLPSHMPRTFWRSVKRRGRFVLQEVQARPREFFRATRENGRLRLQLIRPDSDPVVSIPEGVHDLQLGEGTIEGSQVEGERPEGKSNENEGGISEADLDGSAAGKNQNAETTLENCSDSREATPAGNSNGDQFKQDFQHTRFSTALGFDNALNLLSPSQTFLQFPLTSIRPAVR